MATKMAAELQRLREAAQYEAAKGREVFWKAVSCICGDASCTSGSIEPSIVNYTEAMSLVTAEYIIELHNSALTARRAAEDGTEAVRQEVREGLMLLTASVIQKAVEGVRVYGSEEGEIEDILGSLVAFNSWVEHVRQSIVAMEPWN